MGVTKARLLMLAVFVVFYLANSYSGTVQAFMWPVKFAILGLFLAYITFGERKNYKYQSRYLPGYVYLFLSFFFIFGVISIYAYDGVFLHVVDFNTYYNIKILIGFLVIIVFSTQLYKFFSVPKNQSALYFAMIQGAAIVTYSNIVLYLLDINLGRGAGVVGGAGGVGRFSGWLDNPNTLGVILLGTFPVALQVALNRSNKKGWITYESVLVFSMLLLLMLTGSRSALLGMAVMGAMILWSHYRNAIYLAIFLVLIGGIISWYEFNSTDSVVNFTQFHRQGEDVLSGRTFIWKLGRHLVSERPYLGYGMGAEKALIKALKPINATHQGNNLHNSYLSLLVSGGFVGAIQLFIILIIGVKKSIQVFLYRGKSVDEFTILMGSIFTGFLFHAFFETWIFSPGSVYWFLFWAACFWLLSKRRLVGLSMEDRHRITPMSRVSLIKDAGVKKTL